MRLSSVNGRGLTCEAGEIDVSGFFCKQKTAYGVRISDWSSDVCSSDLDAFDQFRIVDADRARLFGHEAERRHPRLGIDLEQENAGEAMFVVPAKIGPRGALAAEQAVRFDRETLPPLRDVIDRKRVV